MVIMVHVRHLESIYSDPGRVYLFNTELPLKGPYFVVYTDSEEYNTDWAYYLVHYNGQTVGMPLLSLQYRE